MRLIFCQKKKMQLNAEITKLINQEEGLQQDIEKEKLEFKNLKQDKENFKEQELANKKNYIRNRNS